MAVYSMTLPCDTDVGEIIELPTRLLKKNVKVPYPY